MNHNAYLRLNSYFSFFSFSNLDTITIKNIADFLHLSLQTVRNDFATILAASSSSKYESSKALDLMDDDYEDDLYQWMEDHYPELEGYEFDYQLTKKEISDIQKGLLDEVPFSSSIFNHIFLSLTQDEYRAWQSLTDVKNEGKTKRLQTFDVLANEQIFPENNHEILYNLKDCMFTSPGEAITISEYNGKKVNITMIPQKLAYDSIDNTYYLLTVEKNHVYQYRLDRIGNIRPANKKERETVYVPTNKELSLLKRAPQVWGMAFNDKKYHVKVRFYNEANVFAKVGRDLSYRTKKKLTQDTVTENGKDIDVLIYEDDVYGIDKFCNWIYSYGSSAIVLEPTEIRERIIRSYKIRKEEYSQKTNN